MAGVSQATTEKFLSIAYVLAAIAGATASITTGIAWGHWRWTLDQCIGRNCSCILYGEYTPSKFLGGDASPCIWVTFGPLIYVLFCIGMAGFHGYRVLFNSQSTRTRTIMSKNEAGEVVDMRTIQVEDTNTLPRGFWITASVFTGIFTLYSLIHFAIFVNGYYRTCNEYRKQLERFLGVHGTAIPVIHGRLACQAIFDFMDYMQPDSGNAYRDGFIHTGTDLSIGISASWFSWIVFGYATYYNVQNARRRDE